MRRRALALAATAVLAGCGGDEDDFAERAAAICKQKRAEIEKLPRPGALILFEDYLEKALPILREQRRQVTDLDGADSGDAQEMLSSWNAVLRALEDMRKGAAAGSDIAIALGLRRAAAAERRADEAARQLGVEECAGFNPLTRR